MIKPVACRTMNPTTGFYRYHNRADIGGLSCERLYTGQDFDKLMSLLVVIKESGVIPSHYNGVDLTATMKEVGL